jgi:hypothetical protein
MDENENKSDKNILKELLNKMLNNQMKILENKSKEQINSLQFTKNEFKILNKKIENLVKLREEKIIKDKLEKEKKEKEKEKKRSKSKNNNNNNNNFNGRKTLNNINNLNKTLNKNSSFGRMTISNTISRRSTSKKIYNTINNNNNEKKDFKRSLTSKKLDVKKNGRKSLINKKPISLKIKPLKINDDNNNNNDIRNTISTINNKNILLTERTNTNFNISEFNEKDNNNNNINNNNNNNNKITFKTLIEIDLLKNITKYLTNSELIIFYSSSKKYFFSLLNSYLNSILKDYKKLFDLVLNQTMENKLSTLEVKFKAEDFEILPEFKLNKGTIRAIECLKESLYIKIFKNEVSMKILEEIEIIYKILFQLIDKDNFVKINDKKIFWNEISKFLLENMNENLANYVNDIAKKFDFSEKNIVKIKKICKDKNIENINPSYMGKLCGTTGLISFVIKDALEYSGIIEDKKTPPLRIKKNYEYQKEIIDNIEKYISIIKKIEENNNNNK